MRQIKLIRNLFFASLMALIPVLSVFEETSALSLSDFMDYHVSADFSQSEVHAGETFTADVVGEATCIRDLPFTVSQARMTGRVVARHRGSGDEVTLNSSYSMTIQPFPNNIGEFLRESVTVDLKFPSGSESGIYNVYAKLDHAEVLLLGKYWWEVTSYLPSEERLGPITLLADEEEGGGGGGIIVNPEDLTVYIDDAGKFLQDVTFKSSDKDCWLDVPQDTVVTVNDRAVSELTIEVMATPPALPQGGQVELAGEVYDFGPDGAVFDPAVSLTLSYDPALLPEGLSEQRLYIAMWDDTTDEWVTPESTVDVVQATVTARISHFTAFAILAPSSPAQFSASDLVVSPAQLQVGETLTITFLMSNSGDLPGKRTVSVKINYVEIVARKVSLAGGESEALSLEIATVGYSPGIYSVEAEGLAGSFQVYAVGQSPPPIPVPSSNPTPLAPSTSIPQPTKPINLPALGLVIVGVVVTAIGISILAQRRA